jgi:hypothetical protein
MAVHGEAKASQVSKAGRENHVKIKLYIHTNGRELAQRRRGTRTRISKQNKNMTG